MGDQGGAAKPIIGVRGTGGSTTAPARTNCLFGSGGEGDGSGGFGR